VTPDQVRKAQKLVEAVSELEDFLALDHSVFTAKVGKNVQFIAGFRNAPVAQAAFMLPLETTLDTVRLMATTLRAQLEDMGVS
jgi:hypothetical protein